MEPLSGRMLIEYFPLMSWTPQSVLAAGLEALASTTPLSWCPAATAPRGTARRRRPRLLIGKIGLRSLGSTTQKASGADAGGKGQRCGCRWRETCGGRNHGRRETCGGRDRGRGRSAEGFLLFFVVRGVAWASTGKNRWRAIGEDEELAAAAM